MGSGSCSGSRSLCNGVTVCPPLSAPVDQGFLTRLPGDYIVRPSNCRTNYRFTGEGRQMTDRLATSKVRAALAVGALLVLAACGSSPTQGAKPKTYTGTLTFASFNPFTGPDASFGPEMAAGCIPAANTINLAGGVLGHQAQCVVVDT